MAPTGALGQGQQLVALALGLGEGGEGLRRERGGLGGDRTGHHPLVGEGEAEGDGVQGGAAEVEAVAAGELPLAAAGGLDLRHTGHHLIPQGGICPKGGESIAGAVGLGRGG